MRIACVNQDPGIAPGRAKGAAVHLEAMRAAFADCGAEVLPIDESDPSVVRERLATAHGGRDSSPGRPLDLVYERYALGRAAAARFAAEQGIPYVVEVNAPLALESERWRAADDSEAARAEDRALFGGAVLVAAVSRAVVEYAVERGARAESVELLPNGVDARRFSRARRDELGRSNPVPVGRFVAGFHGRLRPWHGLDLFATACRRLLERGVDLHVLAIGEGEFAAALDGAVPAARRTLLGWLPHDEVGRYVALFDVLPLTYPRDLPCYFSPLKLAEAMAAGAVPVVPASGDLPEIVGEAGVVYPAGDLGRLTDELERLAREPRRRQALSLAATARAEGQSWQRIAARVLELATERVTR